MTVFKGVPNGFYLKSRPKAYKAKDSDITVGGKKGMVLARYPKKYPMNAPQKAIKQAAKNCGIKKGMSKKELQKAMIECIPKEFGY